MASVEAPLRGLPLPANPRSQRRGRDIVSTILSNYGGDPGIEFTPTEENWPEKVVELQPPRLFNRINLYSPISENEGDFASGEEDVGAEYDPYRPQTPPKSRNGHNSNKWQTKMTHQSKEDLLKEPEGKTYENKALPAPPQRIDSKFGKDLIFRTSPPLSAHINSPSVSDGPASNLNGSLSRSSKPASLKLHKSNGSTAASIRSASTSTPPPPPPKLRGTTVSKNSSIQEVLPPPPPPKFGHSRSNSGQSTFSVKRKPVIRAEDISKSLPKLPSPTKSIPAIQKLLPARPIEIDEITVADLAVKHPSVDTERSQRETQRRRNEEVINGQRNDQTLDQRFSDQRSSDQKSPAAERPFPSPPRIHQLSATQQIDQLLQQSSSDSETQRSAKFRKPKLSATQQIDQLLQQSYPVQQEEPLNYESLSRSPPESSSEESEDMKKIFKKIQSKAGLKDDDEISDPAIQPGLGPPGSFRVMNRDEVEAKEKSLPLQKGEFRDMEATKAGDGSISSGYFRREQSLPRHSERPSFTRKWLEDQANVNSGSEQWNAQNSDASTSTIRPYVEHVGIESEATIDDETNRTQFQRDRNFSSSTHSTVTQPIYDRQVYSGTEKFAPTIPDVSIPPMEYDPYNNNLNLSDPSAPNAAIPSPTSPATATNTFTKAVEALKLHQANLAQRKPMFGPVRPPYGPIAHLVANRTSNQNQVKDYQLLCKTDHKGWFGPRPNDVHCVLCQLCLGVDTTLFQCRGCAMVTCLGCKRKVEETMAAKAGKDSAGN